MKGRPLGQCHMYTSKRGRHIHTVTFCQTKEIGEGKTEQRHSETRREA